MSPTGDAQLTSRARPAHPARPSSPAGHLSIRARSLIANDPSYSSRPPTRERPVLQLASDSSSSSLAIRLSARGADLFHQRVAQRTRSWRCSKATRRAGAALERLVTRRPVALVTHRHREHPASCTSRRCRVPRVGVVGVLHIGAATVLSVHVCARPPSTASPSSLAFTYVPVFKSGGQNLTAVREPQGRP
ncbi:hypothetical protein BD626DRAFT_225589 [Schizophyllum amplum]|uniref:Uncharacterized protein n=1 Tax=Schizophyllum amplum TaxID=97359 RepID=A0A550BX04_9AGAR|nr:hypothetical protein BD626DRAFT_225589 [Auriculariopsis ampla]